MCYILVKSPRMAQRKFCSARSPRRSKTQPKDECQGYGAASIKRVGDDFSLLSPSKSLKSRHGRRTLICPLKSRWAEKKKKKQMGIPIAHPDGFMVAVVAASGGYYHSARCAFPVIRNS
jgi:hypothetical protein